LTSIRLSHLLSGLAAATVLAALTALAASPPQGDPAAGKVLYTECAGCHAFNINKVGPKHCGVVGRKAGGVADFTNYSEAMTESKLVWTEKNIDAFLADPMDFLPDTTMQYAGIPDEESRGDIIAYLKQMSADPKVCPKGK
jgi:cytochrome c